MSCGLRHLASATGRAEGAALAREWEDHVRRAGRAADAAEAEGWVAALEERLELLRDVAGQGEAASAAEQLRWIVHSKGMND